MSSTSSGAARLSYVARGHGLPVLLLHAGVTDKRSWEPLLAVIGDRFRSIAYDRRGFGETTYAAEAHSALDDALAVLDAEGVEAPAAVIGASNGGKRAIDLTLAHPERVLGLVLIGAGVRGAPEEDLSAFDKGVRELADAYEAAEGAGDVDLLNGIEAHAWLDGWASESGRVQGPVRDLFLDMNGIALRAADPGDERPLPDAWDRLGDIQVPTLVLCGDLDVVCLSASEHLAREIPGARFELLEGTGHLPHLEGHPRCLELISGFLQELGD